MRSDDICKLCRRFPAIENSHILPGLVTNAIKSDSPTGYFRYPSEPNRRFQDGEKHALLCENCEQRFSTPERDFNDHIFSEFHKNDRDDFSYGPWLHYFITSVVWRTLRFRELTRLTGDLSNPRDAIAKLADAVETMRCYLLGADNLAGSLRCHVVLWTPSLSESGGPEVTGLNVPIRRGTAYGAYIDQQSGFIGSAVNLAGFLCFVVVKGNPRDIWNGTKIDPSGGQLRQPKSSRVVSWRFSLYSSTRKLETQELCPNDSGTKSTMRYTRTPTLGDCEFESGIKPVRANYVPTP